jgi:hypothetical protein
VYRGEEKVTDFLNHESMRTQNQSHGHCWRMFSEVSMPILSLVAGIGR